MRSVILGPLRPRTISCALCLDALWQPLVATRRHSASHTSLPFNSRRHAPIQSALRPATRSQSASASISVSAAAPGQAAASPNPPPMSSSDDATLHVLAFCRTADDAARVQEVANEVATAAADSPAAGPSLLIHLDAIAVPPQAAPALDADGCCRRLARPPAEGGTRTMGRVLLAAPLLGSTQELLRAHGSALGDGVVAVADRQTSGKGRGGNQWTSPQGCLMFSALRRLRESGLPSLELRIKWPNDIYAEGLKVAGALIHTTWQGGCFNVITGIGLNVSNRMPTTCLDELLERAAKQRTAIGGEDSEGSDGGAAPSSAAGPALSVSREAVLTGILASLEEVYDTFERAGFSPLEPEYLAAWLHSGQVMDFVDSGPAAAGADSCVAGAATRAGAVTRLTIRGLSESGFLLAEDAEGGGGRYELTPDGNSLDMMKGLIRRKVQ